jgi:hypothetical protein
MPRKHVSTSLFSTKAWHKKAFRFEVPMARHCKIIANARPKRRTFEKNTRITKAEKGRKMTDRNRISKLHIIILLMFLVSIVSGSKPCKANVLGAEKDLTAEEELTIRNAVYNCEYSFKGEYTKSGKISALLVPNEVTAIYERKPNSVKKLFLQIVNGARPNDAIVALAFNTTLTGHPRIGALLVNFGSGGKALFDEVNCENGVLQRRLTAKMVEDTIEKK